MFLGGREWVHISARLQDRTYFIQMQVAAKAWSVVWE